MDHTEKPASNQQGASEGHPGSILSKLTHLHSTLSALKSYNCSKLKLAQRSDRKSTKRFESAKCCWLFWCCMLSNEYSQYNKKSVLQTKYRPLFSTIQTKYRPQFSKIQTKYRPFFAHFPKSVLQTKCFVTDPVVNTGS